MKKLWIACVIVFFGMSPVWAQTAVTDTVSAAKSTKIPLIQYGIASFYDNKFEGRLTSNGEVFTQKKLTAASNTLPLNCWVKVTNLSNKRSVILRITDRMHPKNKRLIDLSRAAASSLSYTGKGLTRVKVEYLGKKKPASLQTDKVNK